MNDDPMDPRLRHGAESYNTPPEPPLDAMWDAIERARRQTFTPQVVRHVRRGPRLETTPRGLHARPWAGLAAALIAGLVLGHVSARIGAPARPGDSVQAGSSEARVAGHAHPLTEQYLGHAAALLISLPDQLTAEVADPGYVASADALLLQTRLLLDSPEASAPDLRALLEDLEVVLAQVVRLEADTNPLRFELLRQALEQRDVLPRVRDAVVLHIAE